MNKEITEKCPTCNQGLVETIDGDSDACMNCNGSGELRYQEPKLELHHIAKRLPYGLKYKPNNDSDILSDTYADMGNPMGLFKEALENGCEKAIELDNAALTIDLQMIIPDDGSYLLGNGKLLDYPVDDVYLSEVKPILHPLTNLTKEIVHNGERFVPLVRMVRECDFVHSSTELAWMEKSSSRSNRREYRVFYKLRPKIHWDILVYVDGMKHHYVNKLLEWHFDVDNLIEKGLAISVNDLKDNPYS